ncbi:hypothetical protein RclHR1_00490027 [Rhizophagus clarus]|uniref:Uncharacterized protein n=1 Tax=Rhizophagus clarus TaxID=94130 RepID=A0A2Z6RLA3_9GLOM|nr:hypothetical protein RclHR1_00490027 [Rhizophagus clarus]
MSKVCRFWRRNRLCTSLRNKHRNGFLEVLVTLTPTPTPTPTSTLTFQSLTPTLTPTLTLTFTLILRSSCFTFLRYITKLQIRRNERNYRSVETKEIRESFTKTERLLYLILMIISK